MRIRIPDLISFWIILNAERTSAPLIILENTQLLTTYSNKIQLFVLKIDREERNKIIDHFTSDTHKACTLLTVSYYWKIHWNIFILQETRMHSRSCHWCTSTEAFSRDSLSYCLVQETSSYQGSAVRSWTALCWTLRKQRGSFWWPSLPLP